MTRYTDTKTYNKIIQTPSASIKTTTKLHNLNAWRLHGYQFLSPPVHMHGGLIYITLRLDVTGPKLRLEKKSYLEKKTQLHCTCAF